MSRSRLPDRALAFGVHSTRTKVRDLEAGVLSGPLAHDNYMRGFLSHPSLSPLSRALLRYWCSVSDVSDRASSSSIADRRSLSLALACRSRARYSWISTLAHPPLMFFFFISLFRSATIWFGPLENIPRINCKQPARRSRERASERARPVRGERAFSMAFKANMVRFVLKLANVILLFLGK